MSVTDDRRALLRARLRRAGVGTGREVPRRPDPRRAPLSFAQRRMWLHQTIDPADTAYSVCLLLTFTGPVDEQALRAAFAALVRRHELLRTTYHLEGDTPVQRIHADLPPPVHIRGLDEPPVAEWARTLAEVPFDLAAEGPLRLGFARTAPDRLHVVLLVHHIAWDGATFGLLAAELAACYREATGGPAAPPAPEIQYADLAAWEQQRWAADPQPADLAFWRSRLDPRPEPMRLPVDRPVPARPTAAGVRLERRWGPAGAERIRSVAARCATTPFVVFQAALAATLYRFGGGLDLRIGSNVMNRDEPESQVLPGAFGNTVVLHADLHGRPTFAELVRRVRADHEAVTAHQRYPFDQLVEALAPAREPGRGPYVDVLSLFITAPGARDWVPGVSLDWAGVHNGTAQFPLAFEAFLLPDDLRLELTLASDVFDPATGGRLLDQVAAVLERAAADPDSPLPEYSALTAGELTAVRELGTGAPGTDDLPDLCAVLDHALTSRPDAPALEADGTVVSYRELDLRADRLAHLLAVRGARRGTVVALGIPRSVDAVVALLAVPRTGAAFLPFDPTHPVARLAAVFADAEPALVVTAGATDLPASAPDPVRLDDPGVRAELDSAPEGPLPGAGPADADPAYVMFTSGSTGRPKGVLVSHGAIAAQIRWARDAHPLGPDDRVLQKTPSTFDVSLWEAFWPLASAACLVVSRPGVDADPRALSELIVSARVTDVPFVPSMLGAFLDEGDPRACTTVRRIYTAGEALPAELVGRLAAVLPAEVHNLYGPTEAAVHAVATTRPLPVPAADGRPPTIGSPVADTGVHVLDADLAPVPRGVAGELYLSGRQLALGYLRRPELTATRFVAAPDGTRRYRTGDLVRWSAAGTLDYLGRTDVQLKIRGLRVEPAEVEAALLAVPGVSAAAVAGRDLGAGVVLVGYLCGGPSDADLRTALRALLPASLVPSVLVRLDRMPLTTSGKLDRGALPTPRPASAEVDDGEWTPTETIVGAVVADLLGGPLGRHEDLFGRGAHSLTAAQLAGRLRARFAVELPVRAVFDAPTVAALAAHLDAATRTAPSARPADHPDSARGPLSAEQHRLWLAEQSGRDAYVVATALELDGVVDRAILTLALRDVVGRHPVLRTAYGFSAAGEPEQTVLTDAAPPRADAVRSGAEARAAYATAPFDLTAGRVLRVGLQRGPAGSTLVLAAHHVACDEASIEILLADLDRAYRARRSGETDREPPPAVTYAQYAGWQRARLAAHRSSRLDRWRAALRDVPDAPALPSGGPVESGPPHLLQRRLADPAARALQRRCRDLAVTPLAVLQLAAARVLGSPLPLGSPVDLRTDPQLHGVVGCFVNTVVLVAHGDQDLATVRNATLDAVEHGDLPFEEIVAASGGGPPFQVMVAATADDPRTHFAGHAVRGRSAVAVTAKFDLTIGIHTFADGGLGVGLLSPAGRFPVAELSRLSTALCGELAELAR